MVLVDTSVWIRFLGNRAPYAGELDDLLALDEVAGHEFVYGELLVGDSGRRNLLASYNRIQQARTIPHREIVTFVTDRHLYGRGASWIGIHLLASALVERFYLWTADSRLADLSAELGIAYQR